MMSSHGFYCTVCEESFEIRKSWLSHLPTENHQHRARKECLRWGGKTKGCVLVVYCSSYLENADGLLKYFSRGDYSETVTDFVWWPDTKHGLLQFESRKKVNEVLQDLGYRQRSGLKLADCLFQFKKASTCLSLEWSELVQKDVIVPVRGNDSVVKMEPCHSSSNMDDEYEDDAPALDLEDEAPASVEPTERREFRSFDSLSEGESDEAVKARVVDWMNEAACRSISPQPANSESGIKTEPLPSRIAFEDENVSALDSIAEPGILLPTCSPQQLISKQEFHDLDDLSDISSVNSGCTEKLPEIENREDVTVKKENDLVVKKEAENTISEMPHEQINSLEEMSPKASCSTVFREDDMVIKEESVRSSSENDMDSLDDTPLLQRIQSRPDEILELDCGVILKRNSHRVSQFIRIFKSIAISKEKLKILDFIRETLGPEYEVNMFRNWYLKYGLSEQKTLLVHVHLKDDQGNSAGFMAAKNEKVKEKLLQRMKRVPFLLGYDNKKRKKASYFLNSVTGTSFCVLTGALLMGEVQISRLVEYFCTFDPRVRALIGLVYYWAKENKISIATEEYARFSVPSPAAFDWLIILFLIKSKIIPSVRDIQERPHKVILVKDADGAMHDVGFDADPNFAEEWRQRQSSIYKGQLSPELSEAFISDVLRLMQEFCHFVPKLRDGDYILNPRDGEILDRDMILFDKDLSFITKLSSDEIDQFREHIAKLKLKSSLTFLHPFVVTWRINILPKWYAKNTCNMLKKTENLLERFFNSRELYPRGKGKLRFFLAHLSKKKKKKGILGGEEKKRQGQFSDTMEPSLKRKKLNDDDGSRSYEH